MQCRDNKWGLPEEMLYWIISIVLIGVLVALMLPFLNAKLPDSKEVIPKREVIIAE